MYSSSKKHPCTCMIHCWSRKCAYSSMEKDTADTIFWSNDCRHNAILFVNVSISLSCYESATETNFWSEFLPALMKQIFLPYFFLVKSNSNSKLFNVTCREVDHPSKSFVDVSVSKRPLYRVPRYAALYCKSSMALFFLLDNPMHKREFQMCLASRGKTRWCGVDKPFSF